MHPGGVSCPLCDVLVAGSSILEILLLLMLGRYWYKYEVLLLDVYSKYLRNWRFSYTCQKSKCSKNWFSACEDCQVVKKHICVCVCNPNVPLTICQSTPHFTSSLTAIITITTHYHPPSLTHNTMHHSSLLSTPSLPIITSHLITTHRHSSPSPHQSHYIIRSTHIFIHLN